MRKHGGKREGSGRPKIIDDGKVVSVYLSTQELDALESMSQRLNMSRSGVIRYLISLSDDYEG